MRPQCIFNDYYKTEQIKKRKWRVRLGSTEEAIRGGYDEFAYKHR